MKKGSYLKLIALDINGLEANIVDDKNVKDIGEACEYFMDRYQNNIENDIVWVMLPYHFSLK